MPIPICNLPHFSILMLWSLFIPYHRTLEFLSSAEELEVTSSIGYVAHVRARHWNGPCILAATTDAAFMKAPYPSDRSVCVLCTKRGRPKNSLSLSSSCPFTFLLPHSASNHKPVNMYQIKRVIRSTGQWTLSGW